jgi:hypothetical protein
VLDGIKVCTIYLLIATDIATRAGEVGLALSPIVHDDNHYIKVIK